MAQAPEDKRTPGAKRTADCRSNPDKSRLELVLSDKIYRDFRSTLCRAAQAGVVTSKPEFIALLLNLYKAQEVVTGNVSEPVEVVTGNSAKKRKKVVTGNVSEPVEVVTGNVSEPVEVVSVNLPTPAIIAEKLIALYGPAASDKALEYLQELCPGIKISQTEPKGSPGRSIFYKYQDVKKQLKKLSTNQ